MRRDANRHRRGAAVALLVCLFAHPVVAADHDNLEEGLPIATADAYPVGYLGRELQSVFRYERGHDDSDSFVLEPRVEVGFPRNAQLSVAVPFELTDEHDDGLREVRLEALYNLNQERLILPAFSIAAAIDTPTGEDSHGVDPTVKGLASKTLPGTWQRHALHVNFAYLFNDDVQGDERDSGYQVSLGYSGRLTNEAVVVADVVRQETLQKGVEENLGEIGLRYQLHPRAVIAGGIGFGFGDESPDIVITTGFQFAL